MIYLDNISGTPLHAEVKKAMIRYMEKGFANPVSQHRAGDEATEALERAREEVARLINAQRPEIVFTSGGTESVNHALKGVALAMGEKGRHIVTSVIEHQAVLRSLRTLMKMGYRVTAVPVDEYGLVDPTDVEKAITDETILVSIMHANNEIGTIEPIGEIGEITHRLGVIFHTDAVASAGVIPIDVDALNVDLLSMAANQFYGPPGVGALYVRTGTEIAPILDGGIQENNLRAGTQNVIGLVGMGKAAQLAASGMSDRMGYLAGLKTALTGRIAQIGDILLNGHPTKSLPHLVSCSVRYVEGESIVLMLDEEGICISTRSACASGSLRASHVLTAIGRDYNSTQGTLIFSFSMYNTVDEVETTVGALTRSVEFLRGMSPLYDKDR
ncbi:MAG: cysteine desulfurase family protein [Syntrophorhabdales bacterium]|jgi:cysteine desulfurase